MFSQAGGLVVSLAVGFLLLLLFAPTIFQNTESIRTDPQTDTGLTCSTSVSQTSCSISLTLNHEYSDTSQMTVTETAPEAGDVTAAATLAADRRTITIGSLATSTVFTFDVNYQRLADNVSAGVGELLSLYPVILVLGLLFIVLLASVVIFGRLRRGTA